MPPPNWFAGLPVHADELPGDSTLESLPDDVRPLPPGDLHVTVAFLGGISRERALAAWERLDCAGQPVLHAFANDRAALGAERRPSAYGLDLVDPRGELEAFIERWRDRLLVAAGRPAETRDVRPHVTLGRPRGKRGDTIRRREWLAIHPAAVALTLDRIALYTRAEPSSDHRFAIVREREFDGLPATTSKDTRA